MIELYDAHYEMDLGCNMDMWLLKGKVRNHPRFPDGAEISPSTPIEFNEETGTMKTASGKTYQIMSYIRQNEVITQIKKDISNRGYEIH